MSKQKSSMNPHTPWGSTVVFAYPEAGHERDRKKLSCLVEGNTYIINSTTVYSYHTDVVLEEFPDKIFNSVNFENVG